MDERLNILIQEFMNPHSRQLSFAVLIATRNRPAALDTLLNSINALELPPKMLVIVSSGMDISHIIEKHQKLSVLHKRISQRGQIRQKMFGIPEIPKDVDWVLFLDDDLVLEPSSTVNLLKFLSSHQDAASVIGLGLADSSRVDTKSLSFFSKIKAGTVSKSGKNFDYMSSRVPIQTSWLNGASMWRRNQVDKYFFEYLDSNYSICEDLIFSYSRSKSGSMYFVPDARFNFQSNVIPTVNDFEIFRARAYWKYYFVSINSDLSVLLFLLSQVVSTLAFIKRGDIKPKSILLKLKFAIPILHDLVLSFLKKKDPLELMKLRKV